MDTIDNTQPPSIGEELWNVHLRRSESDGEEHDTGRKIAIDSPDRKRDHTVGEELWLIHCKRSRGMTFDGDHDDEEQTNNKKVSTDLPTSPGSTKRTRSNDLKGHTDCRYNLRSKDVVNIKQK